MAKTLGKGSSIRTVAYGTKPSPKSLYGRVYGTSKPNPVRAAGEGDT